MVLQLCHITVLAAGKMISGFNNTNVKCQTSLLRITFSNLLFIYLFIYLFRQTHLHKYHNYINYDIITAK